MVASPTQLLPLSPFDVLPRHNDHHLRFFSQAHFPVNLLKNTQPISDSNTSIYSSQVQNSLFLSISTSDPAKVNQSHPETVFFSVRCPTSSWSIVTLKETCTFQPSKQAPNYHKQGNKHLFITKTTHFKWITYS